MATHAFIRVSTLEQDTEKNKIDILQFANRLKLGNVDLNQAQLLSIKSLINGIDSTLSFMF